MKTDRELLELAAKAASIKPAQSVPVVGEPVAWVNINKQGDITRTVSRRDNWCTTPVFEKPKTSIPAADLARLREKAAEVDELRKDAERPDCGTCANRGRVNGLSQETFCEHCSWSEKWRKNHYKPTATQERQP